MVTKKKRGKLKYGAPSMVTSFQKYEIQKKRHRLLNRERKSAQKKIVFEHYGTSCKDCGISDVEVLTIDHINNDGALHRRLINMDNGYMNANEIYTYLIKNNFPEGYQTLCRNCNWKKYLKYSRRED